MSFQLNFRCSKDETFSIEDKRINKDMKISKIKHLIGLERDLPLNTTLFLEYNNRSLDDNKTLNDYKIIDNKHVINMKIGVIKSKYKQENEIKMNESVFILNKEIKDVLIELNNQINDHQNSLNKIIKYKQGMNICIKHLHILSYL